MYLKQAYREFLTLKTALGMTHHSELENQQQFPVVCIFLLFGEKRGKRYSVPKLFSRFSSDEKIAKNIIIKLKSHS